MSKALVLLIGVAFGVAATLTSKPRSFGLVTDLIGAIGGATILALLTDELGWTIPFGLAGAAALAIVGAAFALLMLRGAHTLLSSPPRA